MAHAAPLPLDGVREIFLVRPLLHVPKARLVATLKAAGIDYAQDPSNPIRASPARVCGSADAGAGA